MVSDVDKRVYSNVVIRRVWESRREVENKVDVEWGVSPSMTGNIGSSSVRWHWGQRTGEVSGMGET